MPPVQRRPTERRVMVLHGDFRGPASLVHLGSLVREVGDAPIVEDYDECRICYEPMASKRTVALGSCSHHFHRTCALVWFEGKNDLLSMTCPFCRAATSVLIGDGYEFRLRPYGSIGQPSAARALREAYNMSPDPTDYLHLRERQTKEKADVVRQIVDSAAAKGVSGQYLADADVELNNLATRLRIYKEMEQVLLAGGLRHTPEELRRLPEVPWNLETAMDMTAAARGVRRLPPTPRIFHPPQFGIRIVSDDEEESEPVHRRPPGSPPPLVPPRFHPQHPQQRPAAERPSPPQRMPVWRRPLVPPRPAAPILLAHWAAVWQQQQQAAERQPQPQRIPQFVRDRTYLEWLRTFTAARAYERLD